MLDIFEILTAVHLGNLYILQLCMHSNLKQCTSLFFLSINYMNCAYIRSHHVCCLPGLRHLPENYEEEKVYTGSYFKLVIIFLRKLKLFFCLRLR